MPIYPPKVNERFRSPALCGSVPAANAAGTSASFQCGCYVRLSLRIDTETKTVEDAGHRSNGCGFMIAAADVIAEYLSGTRLTELHSMDEAEAFGTAEWRLGAFPPERRQCVQVVVEAARAAFAHHRAFVLEEFRGEKALICTCFGVSEDTIEAFIAARSPASVDEVTAACRAGGGCGSCRMLIQELIDAHQSSL